MRGLTYAVILAAMWFPSGAIAASHFIPDCAGNVEIANAHVARVEKNGALVLGDGRSVMLEGIRLPGADGAPESLAGRALSRLREMAMGRPVIFTAIPPQKGRYDRLRAQAFGRSWIQAALLEQVWRGPQSHPTAMNARPIFTRPSSAGVRGMRAFGRSPPTRRGRPKP